MLLKRLLGKEVIDSRGDSMGRVSDIEIDVISGAVKQVLLKSGVSHKYSIKPDDIITVGDKVIIRLRKPDKNKMETFSLLGLKRGVLCNW